MHLMITVATKQLFVIRWAIPRKGEHDTGNFKYIQIAQIWCQMKAESLYFEDVRLKLDFSRISPPKFWIAQSTYFFPKKGKILEDCMSPVLGL